MTKENTEATELNIDDIAPNLTIFHAKMNHQALPIPCWIKVGYTEIKIRSLDDLHTMNLGMLLLMEAQEHYSNKENE